MIDPVAFEIGPIQLHWYGIIIAGAVLIGGLLGTRVARWLNENPDDGWSMLLLVMVLAVIGARLYHVVHLWGDVYSRTLLSSRRSGMAGSASRVPSRAGRSGS